jgi:murein DD-endopeptidase MepM/ murein hydrolase activator NlpD
MDDEQLQFVFEGMDNGLVDLITSVQQRLANFVPPEAAQQLSLFSQSTDASTQKLNDFVPAAQKATVAVAEHGKEHESTSLKVGELREHITSLGNEALPLLGNALSISTTTLRSFKEAGEETTNTLGMVGAGIIGLGLVLAEVSFKSFDNGVEALHKLSEETGMATSQVAGLQTALTAAGGSAGQAQIIVTIFSRNLQAMQVQIDAGQEPTGRFVDTLKQLGVSATDASGQIKPMGDLLPQIMDALRNAREEADNAGRSFNAAGVLTTLFGRAGAQLAPAFLEGSGALKEYTAQADKLGLGSEQQVATLEKWKAASAALQLQIQALGATLGADVAPILTAVAKNSIDLFNALNALPQPMKDAMLIIPLLVGGLLLLSGVVLQLAGSFTTLAASVVSFTVALATNPIALSLIGIAAASVAAGYGLAQLYNKMHEGSGEQKDYAASVDAANKSIDTQIAKLKEQGATQEAVNQTIAGSYTAAVQAYTIANKAVQDYLAALGQQHNGQAINTADLAKHDEAFKSLIQTQEKARAVAQAWTDEAKTNENQTKATESATEALTTQVTRAAAALGLSKNSIEDQAVAQQKLDQFATTAAKSTLTLVGAQSELSNAEKIVGETESQRKESLAQLTTLLNNGNDGQKQYAASVQTLVTLLQDGFTPAQIEAALHQADLNQQLTNMKGASADTVDTLNTLIGMLRDTGAKADEVQQKLLDMFSKPTPAELQLRQQIAANQSTVAQWDAQVANTAPIDQRIAALVKQLDKEQQDGASADQIAKTRAELEANMTAAKDQGTAARIEAGQHEIDKLQNNLTADQAKLKSDEAQRGSLQATADAITNKTAPTLADLAKALQALIDKQTGSGGVVSANKDVDNALNNSLGAWDAITSKISGAISALQGYTDAAARAAGAPMPTVGFGDTSGRLGAVGPAGGPGMPFSGTYPITQPYGPTDVTAEPAYGGYAHFHEGIDYGLPSGTQVSAVSGGRVVAAGYGVVSPGQGNSIVLDLGNGYEAIYSHLSQIAVAADQVVQAGQALGLSGNTGTATTGPHLHFAVTLNGQPVDPSTLLNGTAKAGIDVKIPGGHLLTDAQYAAIQANESSLPLPSPGSPQPMFGIIPGADSGYAVGSATYTSGGSAAASASLGVGAGQTIQALFPSTEAGKAAFDALIRKNASPEALAALQSGDFPRFLALIAPWYAGPGEAAGWPGQILGHIGAVAPMGDNGQLPVAAPGSGQAPTAATPTEDASSVRAKLDTVTAGYQGLQDTLTVVNATIDQMPPEIKAQAQAFQESMGPLGPLFDNVSAAAAQYITDINSGSASSKTLADDQKNLAAAITDYNTSAKVATDQSRALAAAQQIYDAQTQAIASDQQQLSAVVAGTLIQDKTKVTKAQVDSDQTIAQSSQQTAQQALQTALAWHQRVIDDLNNHVSPAQLAADQAAADNAQKNSAKWYEYWHGAESKFEADQKQLHDNAVAAADQLGNAIITALKRQYAEEQDAQIQALEAQKEADLRHLNDQKYNASQIHTTLVQRWQEETQAYKQELDKRTQAANDAAAKQLEAAKGAVDAATQAQIDTLQAGYADKVAAAYAKSGQAISAQLASQSGGAMALRMEQEAKLTGQALATAQLEDAQQAMQTQIATIQKTAADQKKVLEQQAADAKKLLDQQTTDKKQAADADLKARVDEENAFYKAQQDTFTKAEKFINDSYKADEDRIKKFYADQTTDYALQTQARYLIEQNNQDAIIKLLQKYYPEWQTAGKSFGAQLVDGMSQSGIEEYLTGLINTILAPSGKHVSVASTGALLGGGVASASGEIRHSTVSGNNVNVNVTVGGTNASSQEIQEAVRNGVNNALGELIGRGSTLAGTPSP